MTAAVRTAGIAGIVLALGSAAVPAAGAAAVPSAGDAAATATAAAAAQAGRVAARSAAWAIQPTPNPLLRNGGLNAVSCASPSACNAVGERRDGAGAEVTLAESWNGTAWSVQQTPNPAGFPSGTLSGVSCPSATFCVAVGQAVSVTSSQPLAETWNGTTWSIQQTPSVTSAEFNGVSCTSPGACTLVGQYYNGTSTQALAERWNGTTWSVQSTAPGLSTGDFTAVSCSSASACTAVGNRGSHRILSDVSCVPAGGCTAVGHYDGPTEELTLAAAKP